MAWTTFNESGPRGHFKNEIEIVLNSLEVSAF